MNKVLCLIFQATLPIAIAWSMLQGGVYVLHIIAYNSTYSAHILDFWNLHIFAHNSTYLHIFCTYFGFGFERNIMFCTTILPPGLFDAFSTRAEKVYWLRESERDVELVASLPARIRHPRQMR